MITRMGSKWLVKNKNGTQTLGVHTSQADAKKQLAAIEIAKGPVNKGPVKLAKKK